MAHPEQRSDDDLLVASRHDPEAFGAFYDRHVSAVIGFFMLRTRDPEASADLAAETFAAALHGRKRFDPKKGPAASWLYGIARRKLADAFERGSVEDRARRKLGLPRLELDDEALERIVAVAGANADGARAVALLEDLPADQREAIEARVLAEDDYPAIAARLRCSESVIRKRVSRGLAGHLVRLRAQRRDHRRLRARGFRGARGSSGAGELLRHADSGRRGPGQAGADRVPRRRRQ